MRTINPNEAPEGYIAITEIDGCDGCALNSNDFSHIKKCFLSKCSSELRVDNCDVIFIKIIC